MPGLVGLIGYQDPEATKTMLNGMAHRLHPEDRFRNELYCSDTLGLGRVILGGSDSVSQPIWNNDRSACIVMAGEVYGCSERVRELEAKGREFRTESDAEFVLHLQGARWAERRLIADYIVEQD